MKFIAYWFEFYWSLFAMVQLAIIQSNWFRCWLGAEQLWLEPNWTCLLRKTQFWRIISFYKDGCWCQLSWYVVVVTAGAPHALHLHNVRSLYVYMCIRFPGYVWRAMNGWLHYILATISLCKTLPKDIPYHYPNTERSHRIDTNVACTIFGSYKQFSSMAS